MNITRERVVRVALAPYLPYAAGWVMRVWREHSMEDPGVFNPGRNQIDPDILGRVSQFSNIGTLPLEIARAVLNLERVNAVEVTDMTGFGDVLYKDWP